MAPPVARPPIGRAATPAAEQPAASPRTSQTLPAIAMPATVDAAAVEEELEMGEVTVDTPTHTVGRDDVRHEVAEPSSCAIDEVPEATAREEDVWDGVTSFTIQGPEDVSPISARAVRDEEPVAVAAAATAGAAEAPTEDGAALLAGALERVAARVRAGELRAPRFDAGGGDAAALAAALSAVLGVEG